MESGDAGATPVEAGATPKKPPKVQKNDMGWIFKIHLQAQKNPKKPICKPINPTTRPPNPLNRPAHSNISTNG